MDLVRVTFVKPLPPYMPGEDASFLPDAAERLVNMGVAVKAPPPTVAAAEPVAAAIAAPVTAVMPSPRRGRSRQ